MERLKRINPLHERFGYLGVVVLGIVVLLIGLLLRSDIFLTVVGVVLEILGWVGILGGVATTVIAGIASLRSTSAAGGTGSSRPTAAPARSCRSRGDYQGLRSSCW